MEDITQIVVPKKRPTFITVLCILSLIGSGGFGLLQPLYQYVTFDKTYPDKLAQIEEGLERMEDAGMDSGFLYETAQNGLLILEKTAENLGPMTATNILFALLSLLGIFLMFKLKKNGFYLYSAVNLFWMLVPLYFIGMEVGMMTLGIGGFITILFIILYAVNLKHME
ncbi:hypothetical protein DWB61_05215 [Ancylomarina euxinus]|uniref:DUF4064 domain-containing protein n=1 Tax=Ancylomarina euxinus TaxID=2283627 RepID=A0A425Y6A2_9BACT|nr:hypothetical protein [Ancylomarina euxinus]MCZ4694189.1 hypothetical protein [Ancylomarina euxinus]MUP14480.1 hypothetical protein [Ancylomarina euxinus]RRG23781.1 hypothetical protein DWB61_05215 [Ancylomarina euxinus]